MKCKVLYTNGSGSFDEQEYIVPEMQPNEIFVQSIMTGVCRSDIDMMVGKFTALPKHMMGHEGLARVLNVGNEVKGIGQGDLVATRGEPAYADYYNVRDKEFLYVPEAHPRWILEPVACGIHVVEQEFHKISEINKAKGKRLLIMGSGFLAWCAYHRLKTLHIRMEIDVVGRSNKELWGDILKESHEGRYDVVIDLSSNTDIFEKDMLNNNALVIFGVEKNVTTNFSNLLWKACTMVFPSPRHKDFFISMQKARSMIKGGDINVDSFWTKCYNRSTEWQDAFRDGLERPTNYSRGYIVWD